MKSYLCFTGIAIAHIAFLMGEEENNDNSKPAKGIADETSTPAGDVKEAAKPKSPHTFTGYVSFVSDYRFRGISQTMREPAIQGGLDYAHETGFYLGTFGSNVDGTTHYYNNTSMEWDFYGGYKNKLIPCLLSDLVSNVGLIYYYYPGGQTHDQYHTRYITLEVYVELAYKWLSIKYSQSITDYFGVGSHNPPFNWDKNRADHGHGSSQGSSYIEANVTYKVREKLTLLIHGGHVTVANYGRLSYTDWRATLTREYDWFNVFITYVGTNANKDYYNVPDNQFHPRKKELGVQGVVFGVIKTF